MFDSINRPGGTGRITEIHYSSNSNGIFVESLDVKYTVSGGFDQNLDPDLVTPHQDLAPRGRRGRQQLLEQPQPEAENQTNNNKNNHAPRGRNSNRSARKPKAKKKRTPTKAAPAAVVRQPPHQSHGATNAVKKQIGRLTAVLSPNNKNHKKSRQRQQQQHFFSPERAYAQNHRRRAIPADVPSEVILYANGQSGSPVSHISMCPSFLASSSAPPNHATAAAAATTRNPSHPDDVSMDVDALTVSNDDGEDRKLSPTHARVMEARSMATVGSLNMSPSELERIASAAGKGKSMRNNKYSDDDDDDDESMEEEEDDDESCREGAIAAAVVAEKPRLHVTLREVFDDGYKKASKFIGDVVLSSSGNNNNKPNTAANEKEEEAPASDESMDDDDDDNDDTQQQQQRLHQFRTLLHEVLLNSDGMMEETAVAEQMSDYTEGEVGRYLTQLAAQNKIMQTDGWIYNI